MTSEEMETEEIPSPSGAPDKIYSETNNKDEAEGLTKETANYFEEAKQKTLPLTKIDSETQTNVHQADDIKSPKMIPAKASGKKSEDKVDSSSKEADIVRSQCIDDCIIDCLYCFTETCCRCNIM